MVLRYNNTTFVSMVTRNWTNLHRKKTNLSVCLNVLFIFNMFDIIYIHGTWPSSRSMFTEKEKLGSQSSKFNMAEKSKMASKMAAKGENCYKNLLMLTNG